MKKMPAIDAHDWQKADMMTEADILAAAKADESLLPLTDDDLAKIVRTPRAKIIRRALGLSQEKFASIYHIPVGTLRDWEQGRSEPDQAAKAYLKVIASAPDIVSDALKAG